MRDEYDFSKAVKNPFVTERKSIISIRLDQKIIDYFKKLAATTGIPYQTLINSYLAECVEKGLKPTTTWE